MRDCGALQFLLEEPVIYFQGFELQTIDSYRVTIAPDGWVEAIEQQGSTGYTNIDRKHPLFQELVVEISRTSTGTIDELIAEWAADRGNRIADRRRVEGQLLAGI